MRPIHRLVLCGVALLSCAPEVIVSPPEPGTVTVTVAASTIPQGTTTQATANATDSRGRVLTSEPRTWTSSAPLVASVSATGLVTALTPGAAEIRATVLGRTSGASITVSQRVATVGVTPATATRTYADTVRFTGTARATGGAAITGVPITYSVTDNTLATISTSGLVTPTLQLDTVTRTVTVRATADTAVGTAVLTLRKVAIDTLIVTPATANPLAGQTVQMTAQARRLPASVLTNRVVTWASSNTAVATVNASTGLVTAVGAGTANITASSEGKVTTAVITVGATPVQTVELVLPQTTTALTALNLGNGRSQQVNAILKDATGNVLTGRTVTWSSSATGVATVSATGVVTAVAVSGTSTITATSEGRSSNFTLTIGNPVASTTIAANFSLTSVQTVNTNGLVRDISSGGLANRAVTITSLNPSIAAVTPTATQTSATGQFNYAINGVAVGTTSIIASSEGFADTAVVTVTNPVVTQITFEGYLAISNATISVGRTYQAVAVARDASSNIIPGQTITWTSSVPTASTVSASGLVTGVGAGTTTITAAIGGVTASRSFTTGNPVASVLLSSNSISGVVNLVTSVTVTPRDAANTTLSSRPFTFTSADTTIATVALSAANQIQITNRSVGSTTVTVSAEGISSVINVTVTPPPVASVVISGGTSLVSGNTLQLTATTRDAGNNVLTGRTVTWSSSNTGVATINASTGLVTGVGAGSTLITATSEGVNGTATISVSTDVSTVTVEPSSLTLAVGATQSLTATPRNAGGTALTGRTVVWSSLNTGVATVNSSTGLVTATGVGSTTIRATVDGIIGNAAVTVTAAVNACDPVAHTPPSTVTGSVTTTDCVVTAGTTFEDIFSLTSGSSRLMSWNVTPSGGSLLLARQLQQNTSSGPFISTTLSANGMAYGLYGAGTHRFSVRNTTTAPVNYSFTTNGAATIPNECVVVSTSIGSGLSANLSLGTASCLNASKRYGRFWMHMVAGQTVTITMTSGSFDTFLELYPLNGDGSVGTRIASDDDGAGGTNSRIAYTAATTGFLELRTTTFVDNTTGPYTLSMSTSPSNLLAPEANATMTVQTPAPRP